MQKKGLVIIPVIFLLIFSCSGAQKGAIMVTEMKSFPYCAVEMTGSYEQMPIATSILATELAGQKINAENAYFSIFWNDPAVTPAELLKFEVGAALAAPASEVKEPLKLKTWIFPLVANKEYAGEFSPELMGKLYQELFDWAGKNGYTIAGPFIVKFFSDVEPDANGNMSTKLAAFIPVQKIN